jgi:protein-S-isoprenylcysteine O-methyltransferase Ste14
MNPEKSNHYHWGMHADREDLAGEHKAGDAGQVILGIVFLIVWILDSFVLKYTTIPAGNIAWYFRFIPGIILLIISGYLARAGLRIVFGEKRETPGVITEGVFSIVRHPIYLGCILFYPGLICFTLSLSSVAVWILIILFYWFISRHEEKLLLQKFGKEYEDYMNRVPMLLPARLKR